MWCGYYANSITADETDYPLVGGLSGISPETIKELSPKLAHAFDELRKTYPNQFILTLSRILSGKEQIVAGTRYLLVVEVNTNNQIQQCEAVVWEKLWENFFQLELKCPGSSYSIATSSSSATQPQLPQMVYTPFVPVIVHPVPIQPVAPIVQPGGFIELSADELFAIYQKVMNCMELVVKSEPNLNLTHPFIKLVKGMQQQTAAGRKYLLDVFLLVQNTEKPCNVEMLENGHDHIRFKLSCSEPRFVKEVDYP